MVGLLEMKRKTTPRKWTALENYKLRDAVVRLGNTKQALDELIIQLPTRSKKQIQSKIFNTFGCKGSSEANKAEYLKNSTLKAHPIDWSESLEQNYKLAAGKYGAEVINGVLMKDGSVLAGCSWLVR